MLLLTGGDVSMTKGQRSRLKGHIIYTQQMRVHIYCKLNDYCKACQWWSYIHKRTHIEVRTVTINNGETITPCNVRHMLRQENIANVMLEDLYIRTTVMKL